MPSILSFQATIAIASSLSNRREERPELWARIGCYTPQFLYSFFGENFRAVAAASDVEPLQYLTFQTSDRNIYTTPELTNCALKAFS